MQIFQLHPHVCCSENLKEKCFSKFVRLIGHLLVFAYTVCAVFILNKLNIFGHVFTPVFLLLL